MSKKKVVSALLAAVLAANAGAVLAQPGPPGQNHRPGPNNHPPQGQHRPPANHVNRPPAHHVNRPPARAEAFRPDPPAVRWSRGERVPYPYRGPQYVVSDWRIHHLRQPPVGYQWVSTGPDYFLIGIATGVVLESVLGR